MFALAVLILAYVAGSVAAFYLRGLGGKIMSAALLCSPLMLVSLLAWSAGRGGCQGGTCGPAMMVTGLAGLLAMPFAVGGTAIVIQAGLAVLLNLVLGTPTRRGVALMATTASLLIATSAVAAAWHATRGQPSASCRQQLYRVRIAGTVLKVPFGREVSLAGIGPNKRTLTLGDLRDARKVCHSSEHTAEPLDVVQVSFDNGDLMIDRFDAVRSTFETGLLFGDDAWHNRSTICDSPLRASAKPLFCGAPPGQRAGLTGRREMVLKAATVPLVGGYIRFPDRQTEGPIAGLDGDAWPAARRMTSGRFTIVALQDGWIISAGSNVGDPLGLPHTLAYCSYNPNGFLQCAIRQRLTSTVAAYTDASIQGAPDPLVALPVIERAEAFLQNMS